ncbi:MAG: hypothetical protein JSS30_04095 [Verrucomicrobia bacterium]|nr:hypothetical protein [Verrucomicrobiota bacterium]
MEILESENQATIATFKQTLWASLLGSYLGGFYLVGENYKAMGYPQLAKKARWTGLIGTILASIMISPFAIFKEDYVKGFALFVVVIQGLLSSIFLYYLHFKTIHNWKKLKECLISVPLVLALIPLPFILPEKFMTHIPGFMAMMIPGLLVSQFVKSYQEQHLQETGRKKISNGKLFGSMLLALVLNIAIAFAIGFIVGFISEVL